MCVFVILCFYFSLIPPPPSSTLFPYTTLFRSASDIRHRDLWQLRRNDGPFSWVVIDEDKAVETEIQIFGDRFDVLDRKSTRLNSSHTVISYAVFCLKKKKTTKRV